MNYPQIKPTLNLDFSNTKTLDPRINFRRGTPGAYYDGKTYAKAEENLLSYSENFSQWHSFFSGNETSQDDPFGGTSATLLKEDDTSSESHGLRFDGLASFEDFTTFTFSVYLKKKEIDYVDVSIHGDASQYASVRFNLSAGVVSQSTTAGQFTILEKNIESAPGDWYRAIITAETGGSNSDTKIYIGLSNDSDVVGDRGIVSYDGDGSSGLYVWGAQLEQRDSVTAYTPTNGNPITKYQPQLMFASPDQPRFDHDVLTGESKGLLIEESRTNLFTYSQTLNHMWTRVRIKVTEANVVVAPDGTLTGDKYIQQTGDSQFGNINKKVALTSGTTYTSSIYVKAGQYNGIGLFESNLLGGGVSASYFNIENGTLIGKNPRHDSYSITDVGNGWYRVSITFTAARTNSDLVGFYLHDTSTRTGNGYDGNYIWGAQLEEGSFPTSYIKTSGASATRSADNASITGENFSSWYRQDEGSLYSEALTYGDYIHRVLNFSDGTSNNRIVTTLLSSEQLLVKNNNNTEISIDAGSYNFNQFLKQGTGYKDDNFFVAIGGDEGSSIDRNDSTSGGSVPKSLNKLNIGRSELNTFYLNGHIKKLSYYPQRLTNEQLQQLTK